MMTTGSDYQLDVLLGDQQVGQLSVQQDNLSFSYDKAWLQRGYAISPTLPLTETVITGSPVASFFRNLLPEGQAFEELLTYLGVSRSNLFALVRAIGQETAGALTIGRRENQVKQAIFTPLNLPELQTRLSHRDAFNLVVWSGKVRLSLAGVQDKLNVLFNEHGEMGFGDGSLCSTHILKFEKHQDTHLVVNEWLCLTLAKACGINVAKASILNVGEHQALLVERFDRKQQGHERVLKKHLIDACQALGLPPSFKYERNLGSGRDVQHVRDGVSFAHLFSLANQCKNPAKTKLDILDWMAFNLIIANFDAHGKNISFFVGKDGLSLAPFYDLVNIGLFPGFEQSFAMAIGDQFDPDTLTETDFNDMAVDCNVSITQLKSRIFRMIDKVDASLHELRKADVNARYLAHFCQSLEQNIARLRLIFEKK